MISSFYHNPRVCQTDRKSTARAHPSMVNYSVDKMVLVSLHLCLNEYDIPYPY